MIWFTHSVDIFPLEVIELGFTLWRRNIHDTFGLSRHSLTGLTRTVPRKRGLPGTRGPSQTITCKNIHAARHAERIKRRVVGTYVVCGPCCVIALQRLRSVAGDKTQQRGIWIVINPAAKPGPVSEIWNLCIWATGDFSPPRVKFVCTISVVGAAR